MEEGKLEATTMTLGRTEWLDPARLDRDCSVLGDSLPPSIKNVDK
jgi:hypothetical protein